MTKDQTIIVFQDGKLCRGEQADVLEVGAQRVKVRIMFRDRYETMWFRRRTKKGKYEAIGWNYYILGKEAEAYHWNLERNKC